MTKPEPKIRRLGYAGVSPYGQTLDAQLEPLKAEGCAKIYRENGEAAREIARSYNVHNSTISRLAG